MAIQGDLDRLLAAFSDGKNSDGKRLLPVVVQDHETKEVLMLAYLNQEALKRTIESGRATYFSRSRNEIWIKGESSGNRQWIRSIAWDCDRDAFLFHVDQEGVACHTGERTCFHNILVPQRPDSRDA